MKFLTRPTAGKMSTQQRRKTKRMTRKMKRKTIKKMTKMRKKMIRRMTRRMMIRKTIRRMIRKRRNPSIKGDITTTIVMLPREMLTHGFANMSTITFHQVMNTDQWSMHLCKQDGKTCMLMPMLTLKNKKEQEILLREKWILMFTISPLITSHL